MLNVLWFVAGVLATLAVTMFARSRRRAADPSPPIAEQTDAVAPPAHEPDHLRSTERTELELARRILDDTVRDLEALAGGLGRELAGLASAIEGHTRHVIEAAEPLSRSVRSSRDGLEGSLQRLRSFAEKFLCFAHVDAPALSRVCVRPLLEAVAREISSLGARLRVDIEVAEFLPPVRGDVRALQNALLFLVETLVKLERKATRVELTARAEVRDEAATRVSIEIAVEADGSEEDGPRQEQIVHLGYIAARNLLQAMGGQLAFDGVDGLTQWCFASLPVFESDEDEDEAAPVDVAKRDRRCEPPKGPHAFGGVLILEGDPQLREMVAHELRSRGRNIVSCVDGAAARSLIDATPDRFEVAILAEDSRVENLSTVMAHAIARIPGVRILVLGSARGIATESLPPGTWVDALHKPFGVKELRLTLDRVLAPSSREIEPLL